MGEELTYIAAIALIPLVPAFLLYRLLPPGQTNVSGPFRGLNINLTGSFAGYFLVLLIITSFVVFLIRRQPVPQVPPAYQYEVYTVTGTIDLKTGDTSPVLDHKQFTLSLAPPERAVGPDGSFSFDIPVRPDQTGQPAFPDLIVTYQDPNYETATVHLDDTSPYQQAFKIDCNRETKRIDITPAVTLGTNPPYHPNVVAEPYNPPAAK
jgi:hypothetical protein